MLPLWQIHLCDVIQCNIVTTVVNLELTVTAVTEAVNRQLNRMVQNAKATTWTHGLKLTNTQRMSHSPKQYSHVLMKGENDWL